MNIDKLLEKQNIASVLDESKNTEIGSLVLEEFNLDDDTRSEWKKANEESLKLAMQTEEIKNVPFPNAANIKYPVISTASIQFSARALPALIKDREVVKTRIIGRDVDGKKEARADRISRHMSFQLLTEMEEWEGLNDQMLTTLPVLGCMFKKTYYSSLKRRNVSDLIFPENCVIHYKTKSVEEATRISHVLELTPNEIISRQRNGSFLETDLWESAVVDEDEYYGDKDAPQKFIEQHRWLDLDNDGYKEPYIVTIHKSTGILVRIVARWEKEGIKRNQKGKIELITPINYFTRFPFLLSPDGSIYGFGFGALLRPINKTINQTINQLLDAGTMANRGGGFLAKGIQLGRSKGGGNVDFKFGEWKPVNITGEDLRKGIMPLPAPEPSQVLFSLLGMMINSSEKLSSVADIMTGQAPGADSPATTTLALIEQGMKVFGAIFKRIHRGFKSEYKKLFELNRMFLPEYSYFNVLDEENLVIKKDYNAKDFDIEPISDPGEVTETQRLMKAEILKSLIGQGYNDHAIKTRYLEALNIANKEELLPKPAEPKPDPKIELKKAELKLKAEKLKLESVKVLAEVAEIKTRAIKNLADAESKEQGPQLDIYKSQLESMTRIEEGKINAASRLQGMEKPPPNPGNIQGPGGQARPNSPGYRGRQLQQGNMR